MSNFVFYYPFLLWLNLLIPVWWYLAGKSQKVATLSISSTALLGIENAGATANPSRRSRFFVSILFFLIVLGLARPQTKLGVSESQSTGVDIFLAIDVSGSMTALDLSKPPIFVTRLQVAKQVTQDFIDLRSADRLGVIAFAGEPFLLSPLTLNHLWLKESIGKMNVTRLQQGTAVGSAMAMGVARLKELEAKTRILILITDGENNAGKISPESAIELAKTFGVKIYTVGVGSGQRAQLPALDENGNVRFGRFREPIMSRAVVEPVDEESLRKIAKETGGKYFGVQNEDEFERVFQTIDDLEKTEVILREQAIFEEKFHYPVGLALILLLVASLYRWRRAPAYP